MFRTFYWFNQRICHISTKLIKGLIFFLVKSMSYSMLYVQCYMCSVIFFSHLSNSLTQTMTRSAGC